MDKRSQEQMEWYSAEIEKKQREAHDLWTKYSAVQHDLDKLHLEASRLFRMFVNETAISMTEQTKC